MTASSRPSGFLRDAEFLFGELLIVQDKAGENVGYITRELFDKVLREQEMFNRSAWPKFERCDGFDGPLPCCKSAGHSGPHYKGL